MGLSAYIPCYNNRETLPAAIAGIQEQTRRVDELFVIDDGSTDDSAEVCRSLEVRVIIQPENLGRGAARSHAMKEASYDLVLCCDATNSLAPDFVERAVLWFDEPKVAGVFGLITDPNPVGAVCRWRARHLFKADHPHRVTHHAHLITFGTMLRASAVKSVGGFDPSLRHSEDADLGERLLAAGFDVVADPSLKVYSNIVNTLSQTLERYWRWYVGKEERFSLMDYLRLMWFALRSMAFTDMRAGDPIAAGISLLLPNYQLWRFVSRSVRS